MKMNLMTLVSAMLFLSSPAFAVTETWDCDANSCTQTIVYDDGSTNSHWYTSCNSKESCLATQDCGDKVYGEQDEMNHSPYWNLQMQKLLTALTGTQPRGCGPDTNEETPKIYIFSDDMEFLVETAKYAQSPAYYGVSDGTTSRVDFRRPYGAQMTMNIITPTGVIAGLAALDFTDAKCSPKHMLANVLAHVEDGLNVRCGSNSGVVNSPLKIKARQDLEKAILDGLNK